jgi:hypothetical protein
MAGGDDPAHGDCVSRDSLAERYFPALASTTIVPVITGCKAQKYGYVPGVANVN